MDGTIQSLSRSNVYVANDMQLTVSQVGGCLHDKIEDVRKLRRSERIHNLDGTIQSLSRSNVYAANDMQLIVHVLWCTVGSCLLDNIEDA